MKKFVTATIIIAAYFLISCEPAATFDQPLPHNGKSLTAFPERLQGKYLAADQVSVVTITDHLITRHYDFVLKQHKDSIDHAYKIIGDTLIDETDGTKEKVLLKGDTVIYSENWTDTLFNISANHVLKKLKGYYFLNSRYGDNAWEIEKLWLSKGVLIIGGISDENDIQQLKEMAEAPADTIPPNFSLTKRQFKEFVRQGGFREQDTFHLMTENDR